MASRKWNLKSDIDQRDGKKQTSLSSTILDYYNKYGQNRDLEKYFRFRKTCKSSSGGSSIQLSDFENNDPAVERLGKSMENLSVLKTNTKTDNKNKLGKSRSTDSIEMKGKSNEAIDLIDGGVKSSSISPQSNVPKSNAVKIHLKNEKKLKKKKYNFNMESNIVINVSPPENQLLSISNETETNKSFQERAVETTESQTEYITHKLDIPKPHAKLSEHDEHSPTEVPRPTSAASSVASISNKQRLEWDSMADVGYEKSLELGKKKHSLSTLERNTLKKFFAERGLNFDENMVIFAAQKPSSTEVVATAELIKVKIKDNVEKPKEQWKNAFRKIIDDKRKEWNKSDEKSVQPKKNTWENALHKYREKYKFDKTTELCITDPLIHSTPIMPSTSKTAGTADIRIDNNLLKTDQFLSVNEQFYMLEKACQTSVIDMTSKEVQVDNKLLHDISRKSNVSKGSKNATKHEERSMISADSFEFLSPTTYETNCLNNVNVENKENIPSHCDKKYIKDPLEYNKENIEPIQTSTEIAESIEIVKRSSSESISVNSNDFFFKTTTSMESSFKKGLDQLHSLIESKKIDAATKKKLIRKIVKKLLTANYEHSIHSSQSTSTKDSQDRGELAKNIEKSLSSLTDTASSKFDTNLSQRNGELSGVHTLTSNSTPSSIEICNKMKTDSSKSNHDSKEIKSNHDNDTMKDWLQPMTHSEMDYQHHLLLDHRGQELNHIKIQQEKMQDKLYQAQSNYLHQNSVPNQGGNRDISKQVVQLEWIETEINHLLNLKKNLISEKNKRDMLLMKEIINLEKDNKTAGKIDVPNPVPFVKSKISGVIYENIKVSKPKSVYVGSTSQNVEDKTTCLVYNKPNIVKQKSGKTKKHTQIHKDEISKLTISQKIQKDNLADWNSHINMQQIARNRTKLQTPNDDIAVYAREKQQDFIEKYESVRGKLYEDRPIYTQPYNSDHYSEPCSNIQKSSSKKVTNDVYTSITGSDLFLSSNSVSIPEANSTSNTTTHQYDTRTSVAIQTTSSLANTTPFFGVRKKCGCNNACECFCKQKTIRVSNIKNHKNQQTTPESLAYVLTFDEKSTKRSKPSMRSALYKSKGTQNLYTSSEVHPNSSSSSSSAIEINNISSNGSETTKLTLQEYLKIRRPNFVSHAEDRRKCLNELHHLRIKRNEQRNKLFLLSSNNSLRANLMNLNPPPIAVKRIFTSKGLQQQTKRQYNKLPEIMRKEEIAKQKKIKKSNRIVTDMFNRNLQRRVLMGQINLSNSMTVAPI